MSSAKNAISNVTTTVIMFPLSIISSIVVARVLGAEGKGIYTYISVLSSFLIPLFSLGFIQGVRFFIANKQYTISDTLFSVLVNVVVISVLISFGLLVLWKYGWLGKSAAGFVPGYMLLLVLLVFLKTFVLFSQGLLNSDGQFVFSNKQNLLIGIVTPLLIIPFALFFEDKIFGAALATTIAFVIISLNTIFFIIRKYQPSAKFNRLFVNDAYVYGIKGWLGYVAINANTRLDRFLLGMSASAKNLGNYSIATSISELIWVLPNSIGPILFNEVAETTDQTKQIALLTRITRLLMAAAIIIGVVFVLVMNRVIPWLYGKEFTEAVIPLMILVPGSVVMILTKSLTKLFSGTGKIVYSTYTQVGGATFTIVLCFILIPLHGIIGAALASSIGYAVTSFIALYFYKTKYNGSLLSLIIIQRKDISWALNQIKPFLNR